MAARHGHEHEQADTYRADGVDLGERGLGVTEATRGEVEEVVSLVTEVVEVPALVPALVGRVDGHRLVLLDVVQPLAEVGADKVTADEVEQRAPHRHRRRRSPAASHARDAALRPDARERRRRRERGHRARR